MDNEHTTLLLKQQTKLSISHSPSPWNEYKYKNDMDRIKQ